MYPETNLQGSLSGDAPPRMMEHGWVSADVRDPSPPTCTFPQTDSKLTEAEWESYKNTIHRHYMVDKKPLSVLIDTMGKTHNFHASKSQYESRLKKWGFSKNLTKEGWMAVDHRILKRKREGKESEVYRDGNLMRQKKVRKETLRNKLPPASTRHIPSGAPSPELPCGLAVCTPAGSEVTWPKTPNLPWLRFASFLERTGTKDLESATQHDLRSVFPGRDLDSTELDITFEVSSRLRIPQMPEGLQTTMTRLVSNTTVGSRTGEALELTTRLDAIMPEKRVEEHSSTASKILGPTNQNARIQLTKFAIYLLSNDLLTPTHETRWTVIQWLHYKENTRLLASLLSVQQPTIQALKEAIFRVAILAEDIDIVTIVLDSGLNVNEQRVEYEGRPITPLQSVCQRGNLEIARLLITAGANIDFEGHSPFVSGLVSPLAYAAQSGHAKILKMMIAYNAEVNAQSGCSALRAAVSNGDLDSVQILLSAGADANYAGQHRGNPLHHAARVGYTKVIETLLQAGADINATESGKTPLDVAFQEYLSFQFQADIDDDDDHDLYPVQEELSASIHYILNASPRSLESYEIIW